MSLFNVQLYWDEMRDNPDLKQRNIIRKYEALFGSLKDVDIRQTRFYRNYLSKFDLPFRVNTPENLEDDFDWDLLLRLIAGSYSSEMRLVINQEWLKNQSDEILVDVYIKVKSGNNEIEKKLDELWAFQILRLYEIYIVEQMNMLVAVYEDDDDDESEDENEMVDVTECDVSNLCFVTDENEEREQLGEERMFRIQKFNQQIESIRTEIENKNRVERDTTREKEALELLLDELQEQ